MKKKGDPKTGGRRPGVGNHTTTLLKEAILMAAQLTGSDGEGKDELVGYCRFLAREEPKAFAGLLGRVLPTQVDANVDGQLVIQVLRLADNNPPG